MPEPGEFNRAIPGLLPSSAIGGGEDSVEAPSITYAEHRFRWAEVDALRSHTAGMRAQAQAMLPQWSGEGSLDYSLRLDRSFLFEAYAHGVDMVASRPFSKPVTLHPGLPSQLEGMLSNADGSGVPYHDIAHEVMDASVHYGVSVVLTQYPQTKRSADDPPLNLAETRARGIRPYFVHVTAPQILAAVPSMSNGQKVLSEFRYMDIEERKKGEFGQERIPVVWVWRPHEILKFEADPLADDAGGKIRFTQKGPTMPNTLGRIPVTTFYTKRTGYMTGEPALAALADKNIEHWQKSSDLNGLEAFASVGVWLITGVGEKEKKALPKTLRGNTRIVLGKADADMKTVEHTGSAIKILRDGIAKIEDQMMVLAMQPFVADKGGDAKATGIAISEAKGSSQLQRWIRGQEIKWQQAFADAAEWEGAQLDSKFKVNIYSNFLMSLTGSQVLDRLRVVRADREIDRESFLRIMAKFGDIPEEISVEEILARLAEEEKENPVQKASGNEVPKNDDPVVPVQATSRE